MFQAPSSNGIDDGYGPLDARRGRATGLHPNALDTNMIRQLLVAVHGHALAVPAKFAVGRGRNGTGGVATNSRALLEGEKLLGTERLVVDLSGRFDEILQMGAGEEVAEVDELAVVLVLNWVMLAVARS